MRFGLEKSSRRSKCRHYTCEKKKEFITDKGYIQMGTMCAWIIMDSSSGSCKSFYCQDCISKICSDMKRILDPKLWLFH